MTRRHHFAQAVALVTLIGAIAIASSVPASGDDGRREVDFLQTSANTIDDPTTFPGDASRCTLPPPTFEPASPCVLPFSADPGIVAQVTGDWTGTVKFSEEAFVSVLIGGPSQGLDAPFVGFDRFVGSIAGCGTGSLIMRIEGNVNTPLATWAIVPHSGRDGLAGISGSGSGVTQFTGPGGTSVTTAAGRIRCAGHRHDG